MPDLHGWISQQIDRTEHQARAAAELQALEWSCPSTGVVDLGDDLLPTGDRDVAYHIVDHDPATVLRRCAADRKILAIHAPTGGAWTPYACQGCGSDSEYGDFVEHTNDCETLQALAEGYGLTEEQRAQLDRPEAERPKPGPSLLPDGLAEAMYGNLYAAFLGARPVEPRPGVKAMEILAPELKKVSGYVPTTEEQQ